MSSWNETYSLASGTARTYNIAGLAPSTAYGFEVFS